MLPNKDMVGYELLRRDVLLETRWLRLKREEWFCVELFTDQPNAFLSCMYLNYKSLGSNVKYLPLTMIQTVKSSHISASQTLSSMLTLESLCSGIRPCFLCPSLRCYLSTLPFSDLSLCLKNKTWQTTVTSSAVGVTPIITRLMKCGS